MQHIQENLWILVTGCRYWRPLNLILPILDVYRPSLVMHGNCDGVDKTAELASKILKIQTWPIDAEWSRYGNAAGPIRNGLMVSHMKQHIQDGGTGLVLAFHRDIDSSKGTKGCINMAKTKGLDVVLISDRSRIDVDFIIE